MLERSSTQQDSADAPRHGSGRADRARSPDCAGDGPLDISRLGAEQSNTSLIYGDRLILKLFRRLQPGINPDFEIGRQLTERVGFTRVPAVAGALEYRMTAEQPMTLAMLQQLVESQADGWRHATDELGRFYEEVAGTAAPAGPTRRHRSSELLAFEVPAAVRDAMAGYLATAETLGRRTGEVHLALASEPATPPSPRNRSRRTTSTTLTADAAAQARRALETLEARPCRAGRLPDEIAAQATRRSSIRNRGCSNASGQAPPLSFSASKIRVHGDYHLGQVLWAEGDFYILDFEGEPARPIAERRQKQSPLKDVAGMLRSFSYAAYAGLFAHLSTRPTPVRRLEPWARIWQTWASAAFLGATSRRSSGALFLPAEPSQRDALLQLFVLDKALYELNYELNNRPDWVRIPLTAILGIIRGE